MLDHHTAAVAALTVHLGPGLRAVGDLILYDVGSQVSGTGDCVERRDHVAKPALREVEHVVVELDDVAAACKPDSCRDCVETDVDLAVDDTHLRMACRNAVEVIRRPVIRSVVPTIIS